MKKVAIYCRVSTLNQAEDGYSISEQQDKLNKYCDIMGWEVIETYTDAGFSGSNIERPAMKKLLKDAANHRFNAILVYKLDRLSRSTSDNLYLIKEVFKKNNIEFVSLNEKIDTSDAMGEFFFTLLAAVAEMERKTITERMVLGRLGRAKAGKTMSYQLPPFGYIRNKEMDILEVVPHEAKIIKYIYSKYISGDSITKICHDLNDKGHIGKNVRWSHSSVKNALTNTVYIAKGKFKGEMYEQEHKKIIDDNTFWLVQDEINKRQIRESQRTNNPRPFQAKYMLSGLMKCGYCGGHIRTVTGNKRLDGSKPVRYVCDRRSDYRKLMEPDEIKCKSGFYRRLDLEQYVIDYLADLPNNESELKEALSIGQTSEFDPTLLLAEIESINKKIDKENYLFRNDYIDEVELQRNVKNLVDTKKLLENQLQENNGDKINEQKRKRILDMLNTGNIREMNYEQQKKIVKSCISKILLTSEEITIEFNF